MPRFIYSCIFFVLFGMVVATYAALNTDLIVPPAQDELLNWGKIGILAGLLISISGIFGAICYLLDMVVHRQFYESVKR